MVVIGATQHVSGESRVSTCYCYECRPEVSADGVYVVAWSVEDEDGPPVVRRLPAASAVLATALRLDE